MNNYFIENLETGKIELHFDKSLYMALEESQKSQIKSNFLFSRYSSAWISRRKYPNLYGLKDLAKSLGLEDGGTEGERLSFEEQEQNRIARAERRADRYEYKAEKADKEGERLTAPIDRMHGDIAFFTQPNINTSAGRAFTRQRDRMWNSWERGMEEHHKADHYRDRAETARKSAELPAIDFCQRRIDEAAAAIRKLQKWTTPDPDRIAAEQSKIDYYTALIEQQGGIKYNKENINKGDLLKVKTWGLVKVVRTGPKNITFEFTASHMTYADGSPMQGKAAYSEILEVVTA